MPGYATGTLGLTPDGAAALETGVSMARSGVGTRGELVGSRATSGLALAFKVRQPEQTAAQRAPGPTRGRGDAVAHRP
ncbi:MAG: hypothetical protein OXH75_21365 [Acidobacteria bacterium]|nr:hypothetical protein [Acidobacteriota bacterium]